MLRCDFGCRRWATDVIRIGRSWHQTCGDHADSMAHADRMPASRAVLRRVGLAR
jgi:hypothetical protein